MTVVTVSDGSIFNIWIYGYGFKADKLNLTLFFFNIYALFGSKQKLLFPLLTPASQESRTVVLLPFPLKQTKPLRGVFL